MADDTNDPTGFEAAIKPLFRERDRNSMLNRFDLWSYDDVAKVLRTSITGRRGRLVVRACT